MQAPNKLVTMPSFIYFDLDNTLLDHTRAEQEALRDTKEHFDLLKEIDLNEWKETYHQINVSLWNRYGRQEIDRPYLQHHRFSDTLEALKLDSSFSDEIADYYINRYPVYWSWVDGAQEAFDNIREKYGVGILTNGFSEIQHKKFDKFHFYEKAQHIVISEEVGFMKPQPEIFEHATKITGFDADTILYVGDSYTSDITGGAEFGWKTAWFTNEIKEDEQDKADFVFNDFQLLLEALHF